MSGYPLDHPRPEWMTVEWLRQQTEVEWVDDSGDPWVVRRPDVASGWKIWLNGDLSVHPGASSEYVLTKLDAYGVKSLNAAYDARAVPPTEVTITRDQLRQAIIKAGPANPLRLLDELWATLAGGAS